MQSFLIFLLHLEVAIASTIAASSVGASVELFQWNWVDVANECETFLSKKGFKAVQVSPPTEESSGSQWWTVYQPVSYKLVSRFGTEEQFKDMISRCEKVNVTVIVDVVINHMAGGSGVGVNGTVFTSRSFPEYNSSNFHHNVGDLNSNCGVSNWNDKYNMQYCDLSGLPDLCTGCVDVQKKIAAYLNKLISLGVTYFRINNARHIDATELAFIISQTSKPVTVVSEVINNDVVYYSMYYGLGQVTEFNYASKVNTNLLNEGKMIYFDSFGSGWGLQNDQDSFIFLDNHDTQRNGEAQLTYKDGFLYTFANIFMLAYPYGNPQIMSSYYFSDNNQGPPSVGVDLGAHCLDSINWVCEHRWGPISNMVKWRIAAGTAGIDNWQVGDSSNNQIAFSRNGAAFIALNRGSYVWSATLQTGLKGGFYCNIIGDVEADDTAKCSIIKVNSNGTATFSVKSLSAVALHSFAYYNFPTQQPTIQPSSLPTLNPTTSLPSLEPTFYPSFKPTYLPTDSPTLSPSVFPTLAPTSFPTFHKNSSTNSLSNTSFVIIGVVVGVFITLIVVFCIFWMRKSTFYVNNSIMESLSSTGSQGIRMANPMNVLKWKGNGKSKTGSNLKDDVSSKFRESHNIISNNISLIPWNQIETVPENNMLGKGTFGVVIKAEWKKENEKTSEIVAIKVLTHYMNTESETEKQKYYNLALEEMKQVNDAASKMSSQESIVKVYGLAFGNLSKSLCKALKHVECEAIGIVMRYEAGGSLKHLIYNRNKKLHQNFDILDKIRILSGIARGLAELHAAGIIHADIKPDNVLFGSENQIRLADFGQSIHSSSNLEGSTLEQTTHARGTPIYNAPEMLHNPYGDSNESGKIARASRKTDMYAFAILSWEVLAEERPFQEVYNQAVLGAKVHQGQRPNINKIPPECPLKIIKMIEDCWSSDRFQRKSAIDCFSILQQYHGLMSKTPNDIFISHDETTSGLLPSIFFHRLTSIGYKVYFHNNRKNFDDSITAEDVENKAISGSKAFLLFADENYQTNDYCMKQLRIAKQIRPAIPIIPLFLQTNVDEWTNQDFIYFCQLRSSALVAFDISTIKIVDSDNVNDVETITSTITTNSTIGSKNSIDQLNQVIENLERSLMKSSCIPRRHSKDFSNDYSIQGSDRSPSIFGKKSTTKNSTISSGLTPSNNLNNSEFDDLLPNNFATHISEVSMVNECVSSIGNTSIGNSNQTFSVNSTQDENKNSESLEK